MRFTYLISNFVPVVLALLIMWRGKSRLLKRVVPILIILGMAGLINALAENPALRWGIWSYNVPHSFGILIHGVMLETYIYCILVPIAIGSAAIIFANRLDGGRHGNRRKTSRVR